MSKTIFTIDYKSDNAGREFIKSLRNTGFAILYNHHLDIKLINSVYKEWAKFFNNKEKHNYIFNPDTQDGYFPYRSENAKGYSHKDLKEFYQYYEWGKHPKNMTTSTTNIFNSLMELGNYLLRWIDMYSPNYVKANFSMPLSAMITDSSMNLLRIIHYPPLNKKASDSAIRAAAHEDINLITLLLPSSQPGLQILSVDNEWIEVKCDPSCLVINTGDMLNECSGNYYPSTTHQVINPKGEASRMPRYTIPLFIHPRDEVRLSDQYTARSFLDERLQEIGLK